MNVLLFKKNVFLLFSLMLFSSSVQAENYKLCDGFEYFDISDKDFELIMNGYTENEYLKKEDVRYLKFKCYDYDGNIKSKGTYSTYLVDDPATGKEVNISKELLNIFKELFDAKFNINNVGCINYRYVAGTNILSNHSFGTAVDINYERNPCVTYDKDNKILSRTGEKKYLDRSLEELGMIKPDDVVVKTFKKYGWWWAGNGWRLGQNKRKIDYMHFDRFSKPIKKKYPKKKNKSLFEIIKSFFHKAVIKLKSIFKSIKNKLF